MVYGKFAFGVLLLAATALPVSTGEAETSTTASASARITLHVRSRAEVRPTEDPGTGQLCLGRIPAFHYHLSVQERVEELVAENRLPGRSGNYCVPIPTSLEGKMVLIVAE